MKLIIKALIVALVVGSVLTVINQYDAIVGNAQWRMIPLVLTYCVPFVVFLAGHLSSRQSKN